MGIACGWQVVDNRREAQTLWGDEIEAARRGDRTALERLLRDHEGALYSVCRGMLGNSEDAEDAVQETFLRAIRNLQWFQGKADFRTWLHRMTINHCLDQRRSRRPRRPNRGIGRVFAGDG